MAGIADRDMPTITARHVLVAGTPAVAAWFPYEPEPRHYPTTEAVERAALRIGAAVRFIELISPLRPASGTEEVHPFPPSVPEGDASPGPDTRVGASPLEPVPLDGGRGSRKAAGPCRTRQSEAG